MKFIRTVVLGFALIASPIGMAVAQSGTETFSASGIFNGRQYTSVTVNYDNQSVTLHFTDGSQFTVGVSDPAAFNAMVKMYRQREQEGN